MTPVPNQTPAAPIYELHIADISAFTDAWAVDHHPLPGLIADRSAKLVFASIIAPATSIKGIRAALMVRTNLHPGSLVPYQPDDPRTTPRRNLSLTLMRDHQRWQTRLPSLQRNHHLIIAAKDVPQPSVGSSPDDDQPEPQNTPAANTETFYIFARNPDDAPLVFYREFARRSPTPSLRQWAPHIWQLVHDADAVRPLDTWRIHGWRCDLNYNAIENALTAMVADGNLPIPDGAAGSY